MIDMDKNYNIIYESEYDFFDEGNEKLLNTYDFILDNYWCYNITLRTDMFIHNNDFIYNNKFKGIIALDIDETITKDDYNLINDIINISINCNIKIIFITARWDPFYSNHNGYIRDIIEIFINSLNYKLELWYNPFSYSKFNDINYKSYQLDIARKECLLNKNQCMLIDDNNKNIESAINYGFSYSTLVKMKVIK